MNDRIVMEICEESFIELRDKFMNGEYEDSEELAEMFYEDKSAKLTILDGNLIIIFDESSVAFVGELTKANVERSLLSVISTNKI